MLNPLAFNYKIQVQKIPERGRERGKAAVSVLMVPKFSVIFGFLSPERRSRDLAAGCLRCLWTVGSFFEKASLPLLLFLPIPTNVSFLVYLSWVIFIFTFIFT